MKRKMGMIGALVVGGWMAAAASAQTAFTYQGKLNKDGAPFTGAANMDFNLYDSADGMGYIGTDTVSGVQVVDGLFTVTLGQNVQWDQLFTTDLYIEIVVNGTTLSPRQRITATPRSITAKNLILPFDSSDNNYSNTTPTFRVANQGSGGALIAQSANGSGSAIVGYNSAATGYASGVHGISDTDGGFAVAGTHTKTTGQGFGGYFTCQSTTGFGLLARSLSTTANGTGAGLFQNYATTGYSYGVEGQSSSNNNGFGVRGVAFANNGFSVGVYGLNFSPQGFGGYFENQGGGVALRVVGKTQTNVLEILGGSDLSEGFDVGGGSAEPGAVVVIDENAPGKLAVSARAYDNRVAGVISGAGDVKTGLIMGQNGTLASGEHAVALTGRVYCKVDASFGAIKPGDLLTTSDTPGCAMKAVDMGRAQGAIIGKAMTSLESGTGLVLVLVNLQ